MGEGDVRDAAGTLLPAADALAAAGLVPVQLGAKEGLALINGTDGMLGMLVLAITDLRMLLRTADISAAMSVEAQMGTDRVFAAELQALRPQVGQGSRRPTCAGCSPAPACMAAHREDRFHRVQDAYSLRCSPQVHGAARDTVEHAAAVAGRELASAVDNPVVLADEGRVESNGNFHGAPVALRARLPGDRGGRRGLDLGAAQRPLPRPGPQPRPAAVPRRRPGRRQRADDRAVHPGRDRLRAQAAGGPGQRRLDPVQRDAGGPRLDGLVRGPQAAPLGRRPDPGRRHRAADRRARRSTCGRPPETPPARRPRPPPGPSYVCCASTGSARPAPTGSSRPRSRPPSGWSPRVPSCPPSKK